MVVHRKQIPVRLEFGGDEQDEEEEEKKEVNVELNKETYKDHFPTLSQTSKTQT